MSKRPLQHIFSHRSDGGNMPDPRDPNVLPDFPEPPAELASPKSRWRFERAAWLLSLWDKKDRQGFDSWAGEYVWTDPELANLLPEMAARRAVRLASRAAIECYRRQHGAQQ